MNNKYTAPEVIEVGNADEVILGEGKVGPMTDNSEPLFITDNDLDD